MIPPRDRVGQITRYAEWLADRFGTPINGMWMPERVWEQSLTSDLAEAGVRYTLLDDFHFKNAGLDEDAAARLLHHRRRRQAAVRISRAASGCATRFRSASRRRRSTICGRSPSGSRARSSCSATTAKSSAVWPGTKEHVYDNGWLRRFFDALVGQPQLAQRRDADRSARPGAAARQDLHPRRQLPRNDRVGAAGRAARSNSIISSIDWSMKAAGRKSRRSCAAATGGTSK